MKLKSVIDVLKKTLATSGEQTQSARAGIAEARAHIADLQRQLHEASRHALSRDDLTARIRDVVTRDGDHWIGKIASSLVFGEFALASAEPTAASVRLPGHGTELMSWGALCAAFPDDACAMLEAIVARVPYQPGPPLAERPAILARLTRDLQEIETAEEEAIDDMVHSGISIEHRPEVTERRSSAARVTELDEEREANRRARQAAIDNRPRGASQYLRTGRV